MARAADRLGWVVDPAAVSDGGEGFVDALGGANRMTRVSGPLGTDVDAPWLLRGDVAFIETATACGLQVAGGVAGNDPLAASTRGAGQLIDAALRAGARRVVVGLGGSASTDGGLGCFEVLRSEPRLARAELVAACDVMLPFGAALKFAAQKGAGAEQIPLLATRMEAAAQLYLAETGVDIREIPGAGAAGGLGGALAALGARLVSGIEVVANEIGLVDRVSAADMVVTGEGRLDAHSFDGKAVGWLLEQCRGAGVPALVVVGTSEPGPWLDADRAAGATIVSLVDRFGPGEARSNTLGCIEAVVDAHLRG